MYTPLKLLIFDLTFCLTRALSNFPRYKFPVINALFFGSQPLLQLLLLAHHSLVCHSLYFLSSLRIPSSSSSSIGGCCCHSDSLLFCEPHTLNDSTADSMLRLVPLLFFRLLCIVGELSLFSRCHQLCLDWTSRPLFAGSVWHKIDFFAENRISKI